MTDNTQPEAGSTHIIRYALEMGLLWIDGDGRDKVREALDALDTLENQLEAIGAGGVSGPLMGIAAPPTAQAQAEGWRPISTAPKDGALIVLGARNGVWLGKYLPVYQSGYRPENPWSSMLLNHDHMAERYTRPTHWMPLPPPPTSAEGVEHG